MMNGEMLTRLAQARKDEQDASESIKLLTCPPIFEGLENKRREAHKRVEDLTNAAKAYFLGVFSAQGRVGLPEKVNQRTRTRYEYDDQAAIQWAKANMPIIILTQVDRVAFEAYLKTADLGKLPFVKKVEEAEITLGTDLSMYLQKVEAPVPSPAEEDKIPF
jgi:hypothetical protein